MIRLHRPALVPEVLAIRGKAQRRGHSTSYTRNPSAYATGERRFSFDSEIYGHPSVKEALQAMQHGKCAFCESKVTHIAYGDVEHFRPKGGFRQGERDALERPDYYWLAYEWSNLLFACELCNRRHKRSSFPLLDPMLRARSHRDSIAQEQPLFINPADEDPAESLGFRDEIIYGKDGAGRGEASWRALGLNRIELCERRRDKLDAARTLANVLELAANQPENTELQRVAAKIRSHLDRLSDDDAEYALMFRDAGFRL